MTGPPGPAGTGPLAVAVRRPSVIVNLITDSLREPHRMVNGPGDATADAYTRVTIDCFSGRSLDAKRRLYREIVERLEALGIPRESVSILLRESAVENWGAGGRAASDYDLGFEITV